MSKDLSDALAALTEKANTKPVEKPAPRGAASRVVAAAPPPGAAKGGGGNVGIASPLTEIDVDQREYWADGWRTTDGLFVLPAIKRLLMADDNGEPLEIRFANPGS